LDPVSKEDVEESKENWNGFSESVYTYHQEDHDHLGNIEETWAS
jgi:hypothetical protein